MAVGVAEASTGRAGLAPLVALVAVLLGLLIVFPPVVDTPRTAPATRHSAAVGLGSTPSTLHRVAMPFAVGSSFIVHTPTTEESCRGPNSPHVRPDFYKALPAFQAMRPVAATMVTVAGEVASNRAPLSSLVDELHKLRDTVVQPNPRGAPTSAMLSAQAYKLARCASRFPSVASPQMPVAFAKGLAESCPGSDFGVAHRDMLRFLETGTKARHGRSAFRPTHFVDFGARMYSATQRMRGTETLESSVRWMETFYPRFEEMTVDVFEVDAAAFADTYASVAARRQRAGQPGLRFFPAAIWVHGEGLSMPTAHMMSAELGGGCVAGAAAGRSGCQCVPTVDIAEYFAPFPPGSVAVKMDVEGAEWQLFERLITTGTIDRIGELFLECHSLDFSNDTMFGPETAPIAGRLHRELVFRVSDGGFDCNALHDQLRRFGVHTAPWP